MKLSAILSAVALSGVVLVAHAHGHLKQSTPADGSVIATPPTKVTLTFSEPARLTVAWIQKGDEARQKLESFPEKPALELTLSVPTLSPGAYIVSWRAMGDDGHIVPGQIRFTVSSPGTAGASH